MVRARRAAAADSAVNRALTRTVDSFVSSIPLQGAADSGWYFLAALCPGGTPANRAG
jgi:hypothetical protein